MSIFILAVLAMLLISSCASLRKASAFRETAFRKDSLFASYIQSEVNEGRLAVSQTVVEFYPPEAIALPSGNPVEKPKAVPPPTHIRNTTQSAVKKIIRTELKAAREQSVQTDSTTLSGSESEAETQADEETEAEINEPPSATKFNSTLKTIAVILALLLTGYILIRIRISKVF